jgi:hypothetical protein
MAGEGLAHRHGQVNANRNAVAYAVPSPARRQSKNWVLDPVPLLPASAEAASGMHIHLEQVGAADAH